MREKCYRRDGENHLAPRCPWRDIPRKKMSPFLPESVRSRRPPYSSISLETRVLPQQADSASESEPGSKCEQSFATTVDVWEALLVSTMDSVVVLETGATANPVCLSWLAHQNSMLVKHGFPKVTTLVMGASGTVPLWSWAPWGATPCGLGDVRHVGRREKGGVHCVCIGW